MNIIRRWVCIWHDYFWWWKCKYSRNDWLDDDWCYLHHWGQRLCSDTYLWELIWVIRHTFFHFLVRKKFQRLQNNYCRFQEWLQDMFRFEVLNLERYLRNISIFQLWYLYQHWVVSWYLLIYWKLGSIYPWLDFNEFWRYQQYR